MSIYYANPNLVQQIRDVLGMTEDTATISIKPGEGEHVGQSMITVKQQKATLNMLVAAVAFVAFMHLFIRTVKEAG